MNNCELFYLIVVCLSIEYLYIIQLMSAYKK